jgi:ligand-binding sensor domain-containing protein
VALDPNRPLTRFTLENWTSEDVLPIDVAEALAVTPDRYLWIGTQAGLVRYDVLQVTIFTRLEHPALTTDYVQALHVTPDGALWIGLESGLARMHHGRFESVFQPTPRARLDVV